MSGNIQHESGNSDFTWQLCYFFSYDTKISRLLSCVCPKIYALRLKNPILAQISGVCPEIFSICLETWIIQKYYICFLSYDTTNFQIAQSFQHVSVSFDRLLENFQISRNFRPLSGNFTHVSRFFFNEDESFLSYPKKFCRLFKKMSLYMNIILFFYRMTQKISGLLKNFRIAMLPCYRGFSLSDIVLVWLSACICDSLFEHKPVLDHVCLSASWPIQHYWFVFYWSSCTIQFFSFICLYLVLWVQPILHKQDCVCLKKI